MFKGFLIVISAISMCWISDRPIGVVRNVLNLERKRAKEDNLNELSKYMYAELTTTDKNGKDISYSLLDTSGGYDGKEIAFNTPVTVSFHDFDEGYRVAASFARGLSTDFDQIPLNSGRVFYPANYPGKETGDGDGYIYITFQVYEARTLVARCDLEDILISLKGIPPVLSVKNEKGNPYTIESDGRCFVKDKVFVLDWRRTYFSDPEFANVSIWGRIYIRDPWTGSLKPSEGWQGSMPSAKTLYEVKDGDRYSFSVTDKAGNRSNSVEVIVDFKAPVIKGTLV